ncbi:hypothetical protein FPC831_630016 [Flavobacterium psychrophilum]|nr:hypothetical protein FPC831_630016 [Flavobacterium psychrophilum]
MEVLRLSFCILLNQNNLTMDEKKLETLGIALIVYLLALNWIFIPTKNYSSIAELERYTLLIDIIGIITYLLIVGIVYYKKIKKS